MKITLNQSDLDYYFMGITVSIYILYLVIISISSSLGQNIAHWSGFLAVFLICMIAVKISSRPLVTFDRMLTRIGPDFA